MFEIPETLLWIVAGIGGIFFLIGAIGNLVILLRQVLYRKHESLVPMIGGLAGVVAILVVPIGDVRRYWWIPLFADLGCLPVLIWSVICWRFFYVKPATHSHEDDTGID